jgi:flagellar assembly factor FliW
MATKMATEFQTQKKLELHKLKGDGDFRSQESIDLLTQADIVVTNPPFSLFREYVAQLIEHDKKFLIIGNQNAITYKEIFKLIKENKIWQELIMAEQNGLKFLTITT